MWTLELQGDAELPERVEAFPAEQVDEHLAAGRVVPLTDQHLQLVRAQDTFLDQVIQHLAVGRVHLSTQDRLVAIQKPGDALSGSGHVASAAATLRKRTAMNPGQS